MGWRFFLRSRKVSQQAKLRDIKWKHIQKIKKWHIVKGDKVEIIESKGKGEQGIVKEVIRKRNMVVVEGCRLRKRVTGASAFSARKVEYVEVPIHVTNVMLIDPETSKPTKIKYRRTESGAKVRVAKSGSIIEKPPGPEIDYTMNAKTDTSPTLALKKTYVRPDFAALLARRRADVISKYSAGAAGLTQEAEFA